MIWAPRRQVGVKPIAHHGTPELKKAGNKLVRFKIEKDSYDIPVYEKVMALYEKITMLIKEGVIVSAYALDSKGAAAALSKMAFGNKLGVCIEASVSHNVLFENGLGEGNTGMNTVGFATLCRHT